MDNIGEKWKRMTLELFNFFSKTMEEHGYPVKEVPHPIYQPKDLQEMFKMQGATSRSQVEEMIAFSIVNWDKIRQLPNMKGLSQEPSFKHMLNHFRYPTLMECMRRGMADMIPAKNTAPASTGHATVTAELSDEDKRRLEAWKKNSIVL